MRVVFLLLAAASAAAAQFTASFSPVPLAGTAQVFGNGRTSLWQVSVCSDGQLPVSIPRERILAAAPTVPFLLNKLAEDALLRRADTSKWAVTKRVLGILSDLAGPALAAYGGTSGSTDLLWAGAGTSLLKVLVARATARTPDPNPYFPLLLPDSVSLEAGKCGTWIVAAGLIKGAAPIGPISVTLPGAR